ncbi:unnamed protein product [Echinostoma caproni]|uniref:Uncharacterized protein n=1 Tax=Echinostoma caproni TaxID=27848 RepID=A0A3P8CUH0_9TREM|nr:unnamed protein product [Echinostoma caproni]
MVYLIVVSDYLRARPAPARPIGTFKHWVLLPKFMSTMCPSFGSVFCIRSLDSWLVSLDTV